jgi:hypothetical protein
MNMMVPLSEAAGLVFLLLRLGVSAASNSAYHGYPELWIF